MTSASTRKSFLAAAVLALGLPLLAPGALAQGAYPNRPVTVDVPNTAGGGMDAIARAVSAKMATLMNTSFIIDNRPGANGNIGATMVAKSAPDGYTVLLGQTAQFAINPHMYTNMPYAWDKDLVPVVMLADAPNVVVVGNDSPFRTLKDIVNAGKNSKEELDMATPGQGTPSHLIGVMFQQAAGVKFTHIPYKGAPGAITDTIAGRTSLMLSSVPSALAQIKGGKLRAIAVSAAKRSPSLPDVPTIAEQGFPGFLSRGWYGVLVPTGTPPAIVAKLREAVDSITSRPDFQEKVVKANGYDVVHLRADEVPGFVAAETAKSKALVDPIRSQLK